MATYTPMFRLPVSLLNNSSVQASGFVLYAYLSGTTTPTAMYQDNAGTSAGTSVTLDARGEPTTFKLIWLDESVTYKFVLKTDAGATVWTVDNIPGGSSTQYNTLASAIAAALPAGRTLRMHGRSALGDVSVADYSVVAGGTGTDDGLFFHDMANGNQLKLLHNGIIDVSWAGPVSGEFGALLSTVLQAIRTMSGLNAATVLLPYVAVTATTPINATNLNAKAVTIKGPSVRHINNSLIEINHTGVGIDCTGSRNIRFQDFSVQCSDVVVGTPTGSTVPKTAFLLARTDPGASIDAGYHVFDNVIVDGHCSVASVYDYASEVLSFRDVFLTNRYAGNVVAYHCTQDNDASIASSFVTIATGTQSNSVKTFSGGQLWSTNSGGNGKAVYLRGASNVRFRDIFTQNQGGHSTFFIDGDVECTDITIDGVREEPNGASGGATYSVYYEGTVTGLTIKDYKSSADETSGYFLHGAAGSALYHPKIERINNEYVNNGILMRDVYFPDITFAGTVATASGSTCKRGKIWGTPVSITTCERVDLRDISTGQHCNFYKTTTASVNNGATTDINVSDNYVGESLYSYMIQSAANSGNMSTGFFRTNNAGGTSNTLTLFGQSENNVAVTVPAANTLRITNNTGGASAFYVKISIIS